MKKRASIIITGWILMVSAIYQLSYSQEIWKDTSYSFDERAADLVSRMTLDEKISQMNVYETRAISRFGIKATFGLESLHGVCDWRIGNTPTTMFPISLAMGSTWDTSAIRSVGNAISDELRGLNNAGIRSGFYCMAPVMNIARDPRWGRTGQTYGEDPYHIGEIGKAYIQGFQGNHPKYIKAVTTPKHFACNNEETIRLYGSATVDERSLREYYLPAWKTVFDAGARSVMAAFNGINEVPCQANKVLMTDILKKEWGFKGYTIPDGEGCMFLVNSQNYVSSLPEAVAVSIKAGCDIDLASGFHYVNNIATAINQGLITEAELTEPLTRFFKVRFELGEFDPSAAVPFTSIPASAVNSIKHRDLALSVARKTMVLLKNQDNLLPLDIDDINSIAVIGPFADSAELGGTSGIQPDRVTALEGIKSLVGSQATVSYEKGYSLGDNNYSNAAVTLAQNSDVAILCLGDDVARFSNLNGAGGENYDRPSIEFPNVVNNLAKAVLRVNPKTVVVLFSYEPWAHTWMKDSIPAILEAWYAGQEQGTAIAEVLFGDYNPGGKLTCTWYASDSQLLPIDEYDITKGRTYKYFEGEPLYPFGYGLSYTTFSFSNLRVSPSSIGKDGEATISVDVKNTGDKAGDEVVQLYVHDIVSSIKRPIKELQGFQRVTLQPEETKTVTLKLKTEALSFWDVDKDAFVVEAGDFEIMIGSSSEDIHLKDTIYATNDPVGIIPGATVSHKSSFKMKLAPKGNGIVTIFYTVDDCRQLDKAPLTLAIYNSLGKQIFNTALSKNSSRYIWKGTAANGLLVGKGIYFFKLTHKGSGDVLKTVIAR